MKKTQRDINPYPYSDSNKRYQTYDYYMKHRFGGKCAKISLDAGMTCPNLDGTCGTGGCIYCYGGSSGAASAGTLEEQYAAGAAVMKSKWSCTRFVPYLQAHTNTYAPVATLRSIYRKAAEMPGAVMLDIATRADCLSDEVIELLFETSEKIPLTVELGLQSVHDSTARNIGRGHDFSAFCDGYNRLRAAGGDIQICVHLINGLPGESTAMMINSAEVLGKMRPDMVKLHILHVIRGTALYDMYSRGEYAPMEREDYVETVCSQLEALPAETVIARITGDAPDGLLAAPLWCARKTEVANEIDKLLFIRRTYQGRVM